jgi:hypothetical protein
MLRQHTHGVHPNAAHPPNALHPNALHPNAAHPNAAHPNAAHPNAVRRPPRWRASSAIQQQPIQRGRGDGDDIPVLIGDEATTSEVVDSSSVTTGHTETSRRVLRDQDKWKELEGCVLGSSYTFPERRSPRPQLIMKRLRQKFEDVICMCLATRTIHRHQTRNNFYYYRCHCKSMKLRVTDCPPLPLLYLHKSYDNDGQFGGQW